MFTALGVAGAAAVAYAIYRWLRPPKPEESKDDKKDEKSEESPAQDPGVLQRLRDELRRRQEAAAEEARQEEARRQAAAAEAARKQREAEARRQAALAKAIEVLTEGLSFSSRKEWVGRRAVGETVVGHVDTEGDIPDVGFAIRPIYDMSEIVSLLPDEYAHDEDTFYERLGLGDSLVAIPIERHLIREPIFDDVYKEVIQVVYTLIDVSPSMFEGQAPWRPPVWRPLLRKIVQKVRERSASMMLRPFGGEVGHIVRADANDKAYNAMLRTIDGLQSIDDTSIGPAIKVAIRDVTKHEFDHADIIIVSDGEDKSFDPVEIRATLDKAGIRLHAIMLGTNNAGLQACADVYQIIDEDLTVHAPVVRTKRAAA